MADNPPLNIAEELGKVLSGDGIEALLNELADPGSEWTLGEAARIFGAMEAVGAKGTQAVKNQLAGVRLHTDKEVLFRWRNPSPQTRINNDEVKKQYPKKDHPSLYKEITVSGGVTITLPFDKEEIALPMETPPPPADPMDFPDFQQAAMPEPFI